jgi:biopolymer transport protein ExbD
MSWKVRHEGSPQFVDGLTPGQIAQGLADGHWEPTDEVMGPQDENWVAIENHPVFAEAALDLEPPPAKPHDDETRLDMTPLIDVCLVLLVFFILTTSYAALQRLIQSPAMAREKINGAPKITQQQVDQFMIKVTARMERREEGGQEKDVPVVKVEDKVVPLDGLRAELARYVNDTRKTELLIDHSPRVPHGTIIAIQDAAAGAGIREVHILVPPDELEKGM